MGNIVNRVFDSSGPEGKVRGTPQQIIDKYTQLARDAQLGNDRVAAENFQQHAEHYTRMLGEAMREQEARRESQDQFQNQNQPNRDRPRNDRDFGQDQGANEQPDVAQADPADDRGDSGLIDVPEGRETPVDNGLVETPEAAAEDAPKPQRQRRPRRPRPAPDAGGDAPGPASEAAE